MSPATILIAVNIGIKVLTITAAILTVLVALGA